MKISEIRAWIKERPDRGVRVRCRLTFSVSTPLSITREQCLRLLDEHEKTGMPVEATVVSEHLIILGL